jgi:hypothetical protein
MSFLFGKELFKIIMPQWKNPQYEATNFYNAFELLSFNLSKPLGVQGAFERQVHLWLMA